MRSFITFLVMVVVSLSGCVTGLIEPEVEVEVDASKKYVINQTLIKNGDYYIKHSIHKTVFKGYNEKSDWKTGHYGPGFAWQKNEVLYTKDGDYYTCTFKACSVEEMDFEKKINLGVLINYDNPEKWGDFSGNKAWKDGILHYTLKRNGKVFNYARNYEIYSDTIDEDIEEITNFQYPKLASYWMNPKMTIKEADSLARFHLVIASMDNVSNNRDVLVYLKKRNPNIKLITYVNPPDFFVSSSVLEAVPLQKEIADKIRKDMPEWFLKYANGEQVIFWDHPVYSMDRLNFGTNCPSVDGKKYYQYVTDFLIDRVFSDPIWDGYFMDNSNPTFWWFGSAEWGNGKGLDSDNNGIADEKSFFDDAWSAGVRESIEMIRQAKGNDFLMIGNYGSLDYLDIFNGKMFEEFPNNYLGSKDADGWYFCMDNYSKIGEYTVIHAMSTGDQNRLFTLASALLGDGYYAYGNDCCSYFEYKDVGIPVGEITKNTGLWEREYSKAIVKVWPETKKGEIIYK